MYFEYEIWKEESIAVLNLWSFVVVAVIAIVIGCLNSLSYSILVVEFQFAGSYVILCQKIVVRV